MADYGIDVSSANTIASWPAVRAVPNTWAWCKATQGGGYTNPRFASQFTGASSAGLAAGAYHFPDPNVSVAANVGHFVAIAGAVGAFAKGAFVPLLDIENDKVDGITWTAAAANAFIPAFRDQLRAVTGQRKLCVYASQSWFSSGFLRPDDWADQDVFLCAARYGFSPGNVGWSHKRLAVHQYTDGTPQFGSTLYATDRSMILAPFARDQLTIGHALPAFGKDDDMYKFLVDDATKQQDGSYTRCAEQLPNGAIVGTTWSDISAKVAEFKAGGAPAAVRGVPTDVFDNYEGVSDDVKAANKALAQLPQALAKVTSGGGSAPTAVPVAYDIVATATPKTS
jgi:hypothetical protein